MSIYTISDLHLSFSTDKPMKIFGGAWNHHEEQIKKDWLAKVKPEDYVILPGDHSWALRIEDAVEDLKFINQLPGTKVLLKGNHDLWWGTARKMEDGNSSTISPLCCFCTMTVSQFLLPVKSMQLQVHAAGFAREITNTKPPQTKKYIYAKQVASVHLWRKQIKF